MCTVCSLTQTYDPSRHFGTVDETTAILGTEPGPATLGTEPGPALANVTEAQDAADDISTIYSIQVGDTFSGELDYSGDRDWVAVDVVAGQTYQINLTGPSSGGTLSDPYLRLYDDNGGFVGENDDIVFGVNLESQITFTASTTGTYYIAAGAFDDFYTGTYQIAVQTAAPSPVGTLEELSEYLTDGYWEDQGAGRRSFDTGSSNVISVDITDLTPDGQALARAALEVWEMVANITFVEVNGGADIHFDDYESGLNAYAISTTTGETIVSSEVMITTEWLDTFGTTIDSYSFSTYVHEIGHALGLGHQGAYNGAASYGIDETFANDSWQLSVMSYFSQTANTSTNASYGELVTAMPADILAIQDLYGAPGAGSATAGNTVWGGTGSTLGNYLDDVFDYLAGGSGNGNVGNAPLAMTLYDQGGTDLLDLSVSQSDDRVNLTPGSFSDVLTLIGNLGIAPGTVIENLMTGSGDDRVTGNSAGNRIVSNGGDDSVAGNGGADLLSGGAGHDSLGGGLGDDTIYGGTGNDTLLGGSGHDTLGGGTGQDTLYGGDGHDLLGGAAGNDELWGSNGNDTLQAGTGDDTAGGGAGADIISGGLGADEMIGGSGNDQLWGGDQGDDMSGGTGNDTLGAGTGADTVAGGGGADVLGGGSGADVLSGGDGTDTIYGGTGNDTIDGGAQNDWILGGGGNDEMAGGSGADDFVFAGLFGADEIIDFSLAQGDELLLDDGLWTSSHGSLNEAQVIAQFADFDTQGNVVLTFPNGTAITLDGVTTTNGLAGALDVF